MNRALPIGAIIAAIGIVVLYVSPTYTGAIAAVKGRIAEQDAALVAAARFHTKEAELAAAKNAIAPTDLERLETLIPSSIDNVGVILDLTALASRSGVQLTSINASQPSTASIEEGGAQLPVGSIDLTLSANGTYKAFLTFMAGIERSARLLDITNLTVGGSDTGVYTYSMSVRLYWLR